MAISIKGQPTILFHSPSSNPGWPTAIRDALPDVQFSTDYTAVAPEDVVAAIVWNPPAGMLGSFPNLKLIQVMGAGVEKFLAADVPDGVPIARLVDPGLTARMTEYVLMHCLSLHRGAADMAHDQRDHRWVYVQPKPPAETCVGIMGLGVLGTSCAKALSSIGFDVIGWSKSRKDLDFTTYAGSAELKTFADRADIIVLLLPLTKETEDLVDDEFFALMREGASLINVGRGKLVVDEALLRALEGGRLRHAVLDVFRTEPLPNDHAFWDNPKITITPHNSSSTHPTTAVDQIVGNIRRALAGEPIHNRVDPARGY